MIHPEEDYPADTFKGEEFYDLRFAIREADRKLETLQERHKNLTGKRHVWFK